jgi:hypothetical protein
MWISTSLSFEQLCCGVCACYECEDFAAGFVQTVVPFSMVLM